jgi:signal transduction histidine kinase
MANPPSQADPGGESEELAGRGFGEDFSQTVMSASPDGILAVDEHGIIRICNPAAQELLVRTPDQLVGVPFGFPLVAGEATDIDVLLPDGSTKVVEMRMTATTWQDRPLHIAALRDVTRYRHAESQLHNALQQQHVVVAVTAHELQIPLAGIALYTRQLRLPDSATSPDQRARALDRIQECTSYLQRLVHKYLTASRIDTHMTHAAPIPVRVLDPLLERLADFDYQAQDVQVACSSGLVAFADRSEFSEMVANYLNNAFTYGRPPIVIEAAERLGHIEICFRDSGPGVPEAFVPHLFERYSREPHTLHKIEGTGLGLWIVRKLARANDGDAWYEPNPRGGACFTLKLPSAPHTTPEDVAR